MGDYAAKALAQAAREGAFPSLRLMYLYGALMTLIPYMDGDLTIKNGDTNKHGNSTITDGDLTNKTCGLNHEKRQIRMGTSPTNMVP